MSHRKLSLASATAFALLLTTAGTAIGETCTECFRPAGEPWDCRSTSKRGMCVATEEGCWYFGGVCESSEQTLDGMAAGAVTGPLLEDLPTDPAALAAALPADAPLQLRKRDGVTTVHRTCDGAVLAVLLDDAAQASVLENTRTLVI